MRAMAFSVAVLSLVISFPFSSSAEVIVNGSFETPRITNYRPLTNGAPARAI